MMQLREILLRGASKTDASVKFVGGANVIAGESDTGKSFIMHCIDFALGASKIKKTIDELKGYREVWAEFKSENGDYLTLCRELGASEATVYRCSLDKVRGDGKVVTIKRTGKSKVEDISSVIFSFAGIPEAKLRKNSDGKLQRLTLRTLLPTFFVDEVSIIAEKSPILGEAAYDKTASKRMFSYVISGEDDSAVVEREKKEIAAAKAKAQMDVLQNLIEPLSQRVGQGWARLTMEGQSYDQVVLHIEEVSDSLSSLGDARDALIESRQEHMMARQKLEGQAVGVEELLTRYSLLSERYQSDLDRLDFVAEGVHYFDGLQEITCPLCEQPMDEKHLADSETKPKSVAIYEAARAEAAKIRGMQRDLKVATQNLSERQEALRSEINSLNRQISKESMEISEFLVPEIEVHTTVLNQLFETKADFEVQGADERQLESLRAMLTKIVAETSAKGEGERKWEPTPQAQVAKLCRHISKVLKGWDWGGPGLVTFDEEHFDFNVDGQARISHGKGVRAVLHAAFMFGLLEYCVENGLPHPGLIVMDSPLTTYKKRDPMPDRVDKLDPNIEAAFWRYLPHISRDVQVIVIENKEPPQEVVEDIHYEWFSGKGADAGERRGFIPV